MSEFIQLIENHPVYSVLIGKAIWGAIVDAFPAPTADSSPQYRFAFSFVNALAFNFARAKGATIESSPNFIPAAEKYMAQKQLAGQ